VNAAEIIRDAVRDVVSHPHRARVMVRRTKVVAPTFEPGERG
jgi:hypothetical protein